MKLDEKRKERYETRERTEEDVADGVYLSFDKIVEEEGGSKNGANIDAASKYARECIARRGKWVYWDSWRQRLYFLYIHMRFRQSWKHTRGLASIETDAKDAIAATRMVDEKAADKQESNTTDKQAGKPNSRPKAASKKQQERDPEDARTREIKRYFCVYV